MWRHESELKGSLRLNLRLALRMCTLQLSNRGETIYARVARQYSLANVFSSWVAAVKDVVCFCSEQLGLWYGDGLQFDSCDEFHLD